VADRVWFSSLAHHAWKNRAQSLRLDETLEWVTGLLPVPTLTVFLHAGRDVLMARVHSRNHRTRREVVTAAQEARWWECSRGAPRHLRHHCRRAASVLRERLRNALRPTGPVPLTGRIA
jgi:hypothetical protein